MSKEMKIITAANEMEEFQWSDLVQSSKVASWFQTRDAYDFFDGLSFLEAFCVAVESDGVLKGIVVGYIQKDGGKFKQFFSRRAIINGGPLLADDISDEELIALLTTVKEKLTRKAIFVETRNFNDYGQWKAVFEKCGFEYEQHLNFHVNCISSDTIWNNLKDNRRRQIKKAIKDGVIIEEAKSEEDLMSYYSILQNLYDSKVKKPLFPIEFFLSFYRCGYGKYLLIKDNGAVLGGIMCPILNNKCIYEWFVCGRDLEYKHKYPSIMATWAAIDYANKNMIERFDFMGAGKPNDGGYGVRDFKAKFGGELVEYGRFRYICNPFLYKIGILGVKILKRL